MTSMLGRFVSLATIAALTATGLSGCGLLDGSSRIEDALEYLPDQSTTVTFIDRAAIADRLELADLETGASEDEIGDWISAQSKEGYGTELSRWISVMQEAAFSDFDVEWEATGTSQDGLVRLWKLHEDVDFDDISNDLQDAGYQRTTKGDAEVFAIELSDADPTTGLLGGRYPAVLLNLALIPGEHLIVSGNVEEGLGVASDDKDSLADSDRFDDLLGEAPSQDDLEYAGLIVSPNCGGRNLSPEQQEAAYGDLGKPRGLGYFVVTDEPLKAVRLFNSDETAKDDANGLATYLDGTARQTGLDVDFGVEADGDVVVSEADFDDRAIVTTAWNRADGPFACAPE